MNQLQGQNRLKSRKTTKTKSRKSQQKNHQSPTADETNTAESYTGVNSYGNWLQELLSGPRNVHGFRCPDKLWKRFISRLKREGWSSCGDFLTPIILFIVAVLEMRIPGVNIRSTIDKKVLDHKLPIQIENFNLKVDRVVRRHRRIYHEYDPEPNFYNPRSLDWEYRSDEDLNDRGHVVGCGCSVCRIQGKGGFH